MHACITHKLSTAGESSRAQRAKVLIGPTLPVEIVFLQRKSAKCETKAPYRSTACGLPLLNFLTTSSHLNLPSLSSSCDAIINCHAFLRYEIRIAELDVRCNAKFGRETHAIAPSITSSLFAR